jgi:hypothetical protein
MSVDPTNIKNAMEAILLPVEEEVEVNGIPKRQPVKYIAEITKSIETTSKSSGAGMLRLSLTVYYQNRRITFDDFLSYQENALFRLGGLMAILELDVNKADTDDFLGKFVYVTIIHSELEDQQTHEKRMINKVARYVGVPTPETIKAVIPDDNPF